MAIWSGLGTGARVVLVTGAAGVAAAAGWFSLSGHPEVPSTQNDLAAVAFDPKPAVAAEPAAIEPVKVQPVVPQTVEPTAVEPPAVEPTVAEPVTAKPSAPEPDVIAPKPALPEAAPIAPKFDVVRIEPDGSATIAGLAAPNATVSVVLDGTAITTTTADASGNFAALFTLPPSAAPRLLSLAATGADGLVVAGPDTVAVAPIVAAVEINPPLATGAPEVVADVQAPVDSVAPAALLVTEAGVEVLQSGVAATAQIAANVSVDTISYDAVGDVMLGGRGAGSEFVRLYLDGKEIAVVNVGADGQWATTLADVAPGIYTLRADQVAADGKVSSRFQTPFKRETLQALAAAAAPIPKIAVPDVEPAAVNPAGTGLAAIEPIDPNPSITAAPTEAAPAAPAIAVVEPAAPAELVAQPAKPAPAPAADAEPATTVAAALGGEPAADPLPSTPVSITVQPGFTLWSIAKAQMGDGVMYVQVFEANKDKIRDPDLIYPGQIFTMPGAN